MQHAEQIERVVPANVCNFNNEKRHLKRKNND